jgi:hypothetical protein
MYVQARSFVVTVRGKRLRVAVQRHAGAGTDLTFFFVHGFGGCVDGWEEQMRHLSTYA